MDGWMVVEYEKQEQRLAASQVKMLRGHGWRRGRGGRQRKGGEAEGWGGLS